MHFNNDATALRHHAKRTVRILGCMFAAVQRLPAANGTIVLASSGSRDFFRHSMSFFHLKKAIMMVNKLYVLTPALTGCPAAVSAYVIRHRFRRQKTQQQRDDLRAWEGEGGKSASSAVSPCPGRLSHSMSLPA